MKAVLSTTVLVLVMASAARAQGLQPAIALNLGSSGLGIEVDLVCARFPWLGIYGREQAGIDSRAVTIGGRLYVLGDCTGKFFVSGGRSAKMLGRFGNRLYRRLALGLAAYRRR